MRGLLELLVLDRGFLVAARRLDLFLELPVHGRGGHRLDAHARGGLVDEVDRLVGQEAVGDVPVGQLRRSLEGLVGDVDLVVRLVAVAQALEDLHALFQRRLVDGDLLEATLQRRVPLEVLAVLVQRRRAHRLQLTASQRRLQDRSGVDRALRGTRADEVVELVDEQDDVAALGDLLHHLLQAFLELTAVLRARDQGREVERVDLLVLEQLRHVAVGDPLGEAFDHGGLAHARLTHEHGVVLGPAGEDLHDPLDLGLATDDRIELAVGGQLGQVATELVQQLGRLLLARAGGAGTRTRLLAGAARGTAPAGARKHPDDLVADLLGVGVEVEQDARGHALVLANEAEQDVLGADVVVAEGQRLTQSQFQHLLGAWREGDLAGGDFLSGSDDADDLGADALHGDVQGLEYACGETLLLTEEAEEDVLGPDVVVLERPRLLLGEDDHLTCSLCESLEHGLGSFLPTSARLALGRSVVLGWVGRAVTETAGRQKYPGSHPCMRRDRRSGSALGARLWPYTSLPTEWTPQACSTNGLIRRASDRPRGPARLTP